MHGTGDHDMASIVEFRRPSLSDRQSAPKSGSGSAEIVLFPGVRYERQDDELAEPAPSRRRARRRDHLDFDD